MHHRFARSVENIVIASESVAEDPNVSIPRRSQELELSYGTLWRIMLLDLHLHPYKVQLTQQRRGYVEQEIFSSAMKHISHSVGINKIVVFGVLGIPKEKITF